VVARMQLVPCARGLGGVAASHPYRAAPLTVERNPSGGTPPRPPAHGLRPRVPCNALPESWSGGATDTSSLQWASHGLRPRYPRYPVLESLGSDSPATTGLGWLAGPANRSIGQEVRRGLRLRVPSCPVPESLSNAVITSQLRWSTGHADGRSGQQAPNASLFLVPCSLVPGAGRWGEDTGVV
jgi:hypothetical protein